MRSWHPRWPPSTFWVRAQLQAPSCTPNSTRTCTCTHTHIRTRMHMWRGRGRSTCTSTTSARGARASPLQGTPHPRTHTGIHGGADTIVRTVTSDTASHTDTLPHTLTHGHPITHTNTHHTYEYPIIPTITYGHLTTRSHTDIPPPHKYITQSQTPHHTQFHTDIPSPTCRHLTTQHTQTPHHSHPRTRCWGAARGHRSALMVLQHARSGARCHEGAPGLKRAWGLL